MKAFALVQYLEKPVLREEREIDALLHELFQALNKKTPQMLERLFDDDAIMVLSGQNEKLTKEAYIRKMFDRIQNIRMYSAQNLLIRITASEKATATFHNVVFLKNRVAPLVQPYYCHFQKSKGEWRLTESGNQ